MKEKNDPNIVGSEASKANDEPYSVSSDLKKRRTTECEYKSQLLKEINLMFIDYLDICFKKVKDYKLVEELFNVEAGESLPEGEEFSIEKTEYPYLENSDLTLKGTFDVSNMKYLSNESYEKLKEHTISENDLYVCATEIVGMSGILSPELNGANITGDAFKLVIRDRSEVDIKFLHLYSMSTEYKEQIQQIISNTGEPRLQLDRLKKIKIPIVSIGKQNELVNKIWPVKQGICTMWDSLNDQVHEDADAIMEDLENLSDLKNSVWELLAQVQSKKLSNPFSTGGGGAHFESQVQAFFVLIMLTDGCIANLPVGTIQEINLQGKADGFNTDDIIVHVEDKKTKDFRKLLGQIKHSIKFNKNRNNLEEVIKAFWYDFNNPKLFRKKIDSFILITSSLRDSDQVVKWLLGFARKTKSSEEFFFKIKLKYFSRPNSVNRMELIRTHIEKVNGGRKISNDETYEFLRHFDILELDFDNETGAIPSLIYTLISQYELENPIGKWAQIVMETQSFNQSGGTIIRENLSDDIQSTFNKSIIEPVKPKQVVDESDKYWSEHPKSEILALLILLGKWDVRNNKDIKILKKFLGKENYKNWLSLEKEIPNDFYSSFTYFNGIWTISQKEEMLNLMCKKIFDRELENFEKLAVKVLREPDPSLGRETEYLNEIIEKITKPIYSKELKKGMSEGLAILGNYSELFTFNGCEPHRVKGLVSVSIQKILKDATWQQLATMNDCLPNLAEASPKEFLVQIKNILKEEPNSISTLFQQKSQNMFGGPTPIELPDLTRALERLAWNPDYIKHVCLCLADLEKYYPNEFNTNTAQPIKSIENILRPYSPNTLAKLDTRIKTINALREKNSDLSWKLLLKFLHYPGKILSRTSQPHWKKESSLEYRNEVTREEYNEQVKICSNYLLEDIGRNINRLLDVINHLDRIHRNKIAFFIEKLTSQEFKNLSDEEANSVWCSLKRLTVRHRKHRDIPLSFPIKTLENIENVTKYFIPNDDQVRFKNLFDYNSHELIEETDTWDDPFSKLESERTNAVKELYQKNGLKEILKFINVVRLPEIVGNALAFLDDFELDGEILPKLLGSKDNILNRFIGDYIHNRRKVAGWKWVDEISTKIFENEHLIQFFLSLPFESETWQMVTKKIENNEKEYWKNVSVYKNHLGDYKFAVEKFLQYGRPGAAVKCLWLMTELSKKIDSELIIQALMANSYSGDIEGKGDDMIVEIYKQLCLYDDVDEEKLFGVELAYFSSFIGQSELKPKLLDKKLSTDPEFYSDIIQMIYRSRKTEQNQEQDSSISDKMLENLHNFLNDWKLPPGFEDGMINVLKFNDWIDRVREICKESGHEEMALYNVGMVLSRVTSKEHYYRIPLKIAEILNRLEFEDVRAGYVSGIVNSQGVLIEESPGSTYLKLAKKYRIKAKAAGKLGCDELKPMFEEISHIFEVLSKESKLHFQRQEKLNNNRNN